MHLKKQFGSEYKEDKSSRQKFRNNFNRAFTEVDLL